MIFLVLFHLLAVGAAKPIVELYPNGYYKPYYEAAEDGKIAGVFFTGLWDKEELVGCVEKLRAVSSLPFYCCLDCEWGTSQRVVGGSVYPSMGDYEGDFFLLGQKVAQELKVLGVNVCLAPVLDLASGPLGARSIGSDPYVVARRGADFIRGVQSEGVIACAKHFPGLGGLALDSHEKLPHSDKTVQTLERSDLIPFEAAIEAGVQWVMLGHVLVPSVDPYFPASLSESWVAFLRSMGFQGTILTDDLKMEAVKSYPERTSSADFELTVLKN